MRKPVRIKLGFGTLKIKRERFLRPEEKDHRYPMVRIGKDYWIWISNRLAQETSELPKH